MSDYLPADGDWVRVVLEGEVATSAQGFWVGGKMGDGEFANEIVPGSRHVVSVERIDAPVKVGDILTSDQVTDGRWRSGTVFRVTESAGDSLATILMVRSGQGVRWSSSSGADYSIGEIRAYWNEYVFQVVYLP